MCQEHIDLRPGRVVTQIVRVLPAEGVVDPAVWPKAKTIARIDSLRIRQGEEPEPEPRYDISSSALSPAELAGAVRAHWGIENRLHWVLGVSIPQNLSLLKKIALNLIRADTGDSKKTSLKTKRRRADWDDNLRMRILGINQP